MNEYREPMPSTLIDEQPPLRWHEIVAVILLIVLFDVTIYRGHGFAGYTLLFVIAPILLTLGSPRAHCGSFFWIIGAMTATLAVKLLWCGSVLLVATGFALLVAFAAVLAGIYPYVLEVGVFASQTIVAGRDGLSHYERCLGKMVPAALTRARWLSIALPSLAFVVFSLLFILANPDLLKSFGAHVQVILDAIREWMLHYSPAPWEFVFWAVVLWISVGLLRPLVGRPRSPSFLDNESTATEDSSPSPLYAAFRNTLLTVIVLFAIYLVFEFKTLWCRAFPVGFYYAGYAHEGAAWLTIALALATAILSLVFRKRTLLDPQLPGLRKLAWIWSLENFVLALAVYHRLYIYISFNGMTRMRMIGIYGMTAVVIGFILVVWKIAFNRDFVWLMRRHLWTVALMVYFFALTPVDAIVTHYNVRRILSGDLSPSVQINVHPINSEGIVFLEQLVNLDDKAIREGVLAMLAERQIEMEMQDTCRKEQGWTTFQIVDNLVLQSLKNHSYQWVEYIADAERRNDAIRHFGEYAYQWY
jgi:hypothetical protein